MTAEAIVFLHSNASRGQHWAPQVGRPSVASSDRE
jgi:hypothetical protein